jgi:anaerobic selenocysteine-containing dehydrogenase
VFLQIKPGTNVALFNGMMNVIISEGLQDQKYIDERTEGYAQLVEVVKDYTPEVVAEICQIDAEELKKAARLYAKADKAGNVWYKGTGRNFNPLIATAADVVICEADTVVEIGEIEPENVVTQGIFVDYIVDGGNL